MHPESMGYDSRKSGTREHHRSTVKNVVEFGVFIELVPGMEGLLHISEMTRRQYETLKASASKSGPIQVVVLDVNMNKKQIELSTLPWINACPESGMEQTSATCLESRIRQPWSDLTECGTSGRSLRKGWNLDSSR